MAIHKFEKDVESFLWRQVSIKLTIGLVGILETVEHLNDSRHELDFTMLAAVPPRPPLSAPLLGDSRDQRVAAARVLTRNTSPMSRSIREVGIASR